MTASPSGAFRTGDGLLNIAANKQEQFETLCRLIGRDGPRARSALRRARGSQAEPLRAEGRDRAWRWPRSPASEWSALLNEHGVPAGEVLDVPSVLEHPQVVERGLLQHLRQRAGASIATSAWCARAFGLPAAIRRRRRRRRRSAPTRPRSCRSSATPPPRSMP